MAGGEKPARLDDMDRKILRILQKDADLSVADLAARVGLSHTPCWRRIKQMEADGVILRRTLVLDQSKLGFAVNVFAHVKLRQHDEQTLEALERAAAALPQILECFSMAGDSDYMMRIVSPSIEDYEHFVKKTLLHLPGVAAINSHFALKPIKMTTELPI